MIALYTLAAFLGSLLLGCALGALLFWLDLHFWKKSKTAQNAELRSLVREMYDWTHYKDTPWARRAAKVLGEKDAPNPH